MTIREHLEFAVRLLDRCSPNDPCDYDNTCFNHKARAHVRWVLLALPESVAALPAPCVDLSEGAQAKPMPAEETIS